MIGNGILRLASVGLILCVAHATHAQTHFVELKATSMLYCPQDNRIYATAASDAKGSLANTVCRINPDTGKIEGSVFVGDDPRGIVRTADGKTLYVLTAGNKMVRQVDRAGLVAGLNFPIGDNQAARRIAPVPEVADALIVLRYNPSISQQFDNLCVFVKGVGAMDGVPCGNNFAYGIDSRRVITSSEGGNSNFYFGINALLHTEDGPGFSNGVNMPLVTSGYGLILANSGFVIDPEAHQNLGRLHVDSSELCVDPVRPVAYEVFDDRKPTLRCWDLQTFRELWRSPLPTWNGSHHPSSPIRWGAFGFAYLDGDTIVCGPSNLGKPANPVDLSVSRSGFPSGNVEGKTVNYTLTVKNNSDFPSTGTFLTDTIPGVVAVQSMVASQGSVTYSQGVVRADLGSVPARGSATVQVKLSIQSRGNGGYVAVVRSFDPDPDTSNNIFPGPQFTPHAKFDVGPAVAAGTASSNSFDATWRVLERQAKGAGENLSIQIDGDLEIVNSGKASTKPMVVRFCLQDGPNLVVDWASILQEVEVPALAPGRRYSVTLQAPFASDFDVVGMYVVANIDPLHANGSTVNTSRRIP